MPVRIEVLKLALEEVKVLYQESCALARKYGEEKPQFNNLIRNVVRKMRLSEEDSADLIHELAKTYGRRGGEKQPRKMRAKKQKPEKLPKIKKSIKPWVTLKPIAVDSQTRLDMLNMRRQGHEDICPLQD
jgi:hypothetical protein